MKNKVERIYSAAMEILENVGIRLFHTETLDLLNDNGIRISDNTAFFTPEQIQSWLSHAPKEFELHAPNPKYTSIIGKNHSQYVSAYGCSSICHIDGTRRNTMLDDYIEISRLIHQSPLFHINGGILAQPNDVPAKLSHLIMLYTAMMNSDKCLMGIPGSQSDMEELMEFVALRFGGMSTFKEKNHLLTMISTISPLQIDEMALSSIMVAARHNQPLILSPAPAAGTTGPIDLAANLAMATAEAFAGMVIVQMFNPGTPVIFGLQCYGADLTSGSISIGSPAYSLQAKYTAALARRIGVPSRCGGSANDAKGISPQSGYESMLSMFTACQNNVNLIIHSAGILDSFGTFSYEQFFIDLEIIEMCRYYLDDIEVDSDTLNLDVIKTVGPGREFLTHKDTMKKCRTRSWFPSIGVRGTVRPGVDPMEKYFSNIAKKREQSLSSYEPPEIPDPIKQRMRDYLIEKGVDSAILDKIDSGKTE